MGALTGVFGGGMGAPAGVFRGGIRSMSGIEGMGLCSFGGGYGWTSAPMGEVQDMRAPTGVYEAMGPPPEGFMASMVLQYLLQVMMPMKKKQKMEINKL
jgi:hypothetical protein